MAKKPETRFKEWIRPRLASLPNTWVEKIQQQGIRGTPDFLMCVNGHFVAWEIKKSLVENPLSHEKLQLHKLQKIDRAGGIARRVGPENFEECFRELEVLARTPNRRR